MQTVLVTGGCGYIGSHTIVDLLKNGYNVISIDDNSRSNDSSLAGIKKITGKDVKNYRIDLCRFEDLSAVFSNHKIDGIIHFAAYKAVGESVEDPLLYFDNNLRSLINILKCARDLEVDQFVFSSSCTVYGKPDIVPVTEHTPLKPAESPYGSTKQMGEEIVQAAVQASAKLKAVILRYFNPAGAHPSGFIGELPIGRPQNLVPAITQTAIGKMKGLKVWGTDYPTKDGTCVRDYIHVCDVASAHTLALKFMERKDDVSFAEIFNLGSGTGNTVMEILHAFEEVSGVKLDYTCADRRPGDVDSIYADSSKAAEELSWTPACGISEIIGSAWVWEQQLNKIK